MPDPTLPDPTLPDPTLPDAVAAHVRWRATDGREGTRLNTTRIDLADPEPGVGRAGDDTAGAYRVRPDTSRRGLAGLNLAGLDLADAILVGADLRGADLRGADLFGAVLTGADLEGADLTGAQLGKADLSRVRARGARLRRATLVRTDLDGADLRDADLSRAHLVKTDLSGADLSHADLREADLHLVFVTGSVWDGTTAVDARGTVAGPDVPVVILEDGVRLDRTVADLVAWLGARGAELEVHPDGAALGEPAPWRWAPPPGTDTPDARPAERAPGPDDA